MSKSKVLLIFFSLLIVVVLLVLLSFRFRYFAVICFSVLLFVILFLSNAFHYRKLIVGDNCIVFDALLRKKSVPFEDFKEATIEILRMFVIHTKNGDYPITLTKKTQDGLIKIIMLSDVITEKTKVIEKIKNVISKE